MFDIDAGDIGKINVSHENKEWHFSVFHYLKPMKNYIYVATVSTKNFEEGMEESMVFLSFDLHQKIYEGIV